MTRRHSGSGEPFNANPDTGRMGFRYEWEQRDERPVIVYTEPFWRDRMEEATFEAAVAAFPPKQCECSIEYVMAYARHISETVTNEREAGAKTMPRPRMSRAARDLRLSLLRGQAASDGTVSDP